MLGSGDSSLQETPDSKLYVSGIQISLAKDSSRTISSLKLSKNQQSLKPIKQTINPGSSHREEFGQPPVLRSGDYISVYVDFGSQWWRRNDLVIDIDPRKVDYTPSEGGARSYLKKTSDIEVVVMCHEQPLSEITNKIFRLCSRFRLLIIGNSGVGKSSLIRNTFGINDVHVSDTTRGSADIEQEFVSSKDDGFVVHDALGFEAGDEDYLKIVQEFVARKTSLPRIEDQLHAVWLCFEIPYAGGRFLEAGVERFLRCRKELLGDVPLVVVLTKVDLLERQLEIDLQDNDNLEDVKSKYIDKHCIKLLHDAAGSNVTHVSVSVDEDYSGTLIELLKTTSDSVKSLMSMKPRTDYGGNRSTY